MHVMSTVSLIGNKMCAILQYVSAAFYRTCQNGNNVTYARYLERILDRGNGCKEIDTTVLSAKSDRDVMFCLQLISETLTCTNHLS